MIQKSLRNAGFTLIELSIVLVIIGLIVGGILAGQQLIHNSRIKNTVSQLQEYRTATNSFRIKNTIACPEIARARSVLALAPPAARVITATEMAPSTPAGTAVRRIIISGFISPPQAW